MLTSRHTPQGHTEALSQEISRGAAGTGALYCPLLHNPLCLMLIFQFELKIQPDCDRQGMNVEMLTQQTASILMPAHASTCRTQVLACTLSDVFSSRISCLAAWQKR